MGGVISYLRLNARWNGFGILEENMTAGSLNRAIDDNLCVAELLVELLVVAKEKR